MDRVKEVLIKIVTASFRPVDIEIRKRGVLPEELMAFVKDRCQCGLKEGMTSVQYVCLLNLSGVEEIHAVYVVVRSYPGESKGSTGFLLFEKHKHRSINIFAFSNVAQRS